MSVRDEATAVFSELVATAGLVEPASRFDRLRRLGPVVDSQYGILVTGYDEAIEVLRHPHLNADPATTFRPNGIVDWRENPLTKLFGDSLFFDRGEQHSTVRRIVAASFTPSALAKLGPMIGEVVERRLADLTTSLHTLGQADVVALFARPIPIEVACTMLGLPIDDVPRLTELFLAAQFGAATFDATPEQLARIGEVGRELSTYLGRRLEDSAPGSVLRHIASARTQGALTEDQARALSFVLVGAGFETTSNLIANAVQLVLTHRRTIDASKVDALIDETLRLEAPVQITTRSVEGEWPIRIAGVECAPGSSLLVLLGATGRDERVYPNPHTFDIGRFGAGRDTRTNLAFGSGIHHCIGHHFARQQARLALTSLLPVLAQMRIDASATDWRPLVAVRSLERFTVRIADTRQESTTDPKMIHQLQKSRRKKMNRMVSGVLRTTLLEKAVSVFTPRAKRAAKHATIAKGQADRAVETFGDLRGVMMKYGQMFSYAAPALDETARTAMASLQDGVKPMDPGVAERIVSTELGQPVEQLFTSFDPEPVAAASIGQVHRAILADGRTVAVKVQYEGIADAVAADLSELARTQKLLSRLIMRNLDAKTLSEELSTRVLEELDYESEAAHQIGFARRFAHHPFIRIPTVVRERSNRYILTTEWCDGIRWNDFVTSANQADKDRVGEMVARFVFSSLRRYGIVQADSHPGNFLVAPDASWITVLDFGLVHTYSTAGHRRVVELADLVYGNDPDATLAAFEEMGYFPVKGSISAQRLWEFVAPIRETFGSTGTMTPAKYERAVRTGYDPRAGFADVLRVANGPAETVLGDRVAYGTMAMLSQLHATNDWIGIIRQYSGGPPTTDLGRLEDEWFRSRSGVQPMSTR